MGAPLKLRPSDVTHYRVECKMTESSGAERPSVVTLLTDFGSDDVYAGVMKGVILTLAPQARLVDLTHEVPPQDVVAGALLLESVWRYFPEGSVHLVVVDP